MHARKLIAAAAAAGALAAVALPAADAAPKGKTVVIRDNRFAPASVTVAKGATVTWAWRGKAAHNVHVTKGRSASRAPTRSAAAGRES